MKKLKDEVITDEVTETEEEQEELDNKDAEAAFDEGAGIAPAQEAPAAKEPGTTDEKDEKKAPAADEKKPRPEDTAKEDKGKVKPDETKTIEEPAVKEQKGKPGIDELEKALRDTQAWAHGLSAERVGLNRRIMELEQQVNKQKPAEPTEEPVPDEVRDFYVDYPEAKAAILYEAQKLVKKTFGALNPESLQGIVNEVPALKQELALTKFKNTIITGYFDESGTYVQGHPDGEKIASDPEYWKWWQSKGYQPCDARTAITRLTEYKQYRASLRASAHDAEQEKKAKDLMEMASAVPEPGTRHVKPKPKSDKDKTPEEIFEENIK